MPLEVQGLDSFLRHIAKVESTAKTFDTKVITGLAAETKRVLIGAASPSFLSRFNDGKGVKLSASYQIKPGAEPTAIVFGTPQGAWKILESGARAHRIGNR